MPTTASRTPGDLIRMVDAQRCSKWPFLTAGMVRIIREGRKIRTWQIGRYTYVSADELDEFFASCERPARTPAA